MRPFNQPERDGVNQDLSTPVASYCHDLGTLKSKIELIESTITAVMLIVPSIASHISIKVFLTMERIN